MVVMCGLLWNGSAVSRVLNKELEKELLLSRTILSKQLKKRLMTSQEEILTNNSLKIYLIFKQIENE